jgi:hypothetical protein
VISPTAVAAVLAEQLESSMRYTPRVAFLVVTDVIVLALLLLGGCVATPSKYQERNGDFIMNIGSTKVSPAPAAIGTAPMLSAPLSGVGADD